jgi:hypothetical protein
MNSEADHTRHLPGLDTPCRYAIRVVGHLDAHWSEWLEGMSITHEEGGTTLLEGELIDQSALLGLLDKLADLQLRIRAVERRDPTSGDG